MKYGRGYIGDGRHAGTMSNVVYNRWRSMFDRCYCLPFLEKHPAYVGSSVCESWFNFQVFGDWCEMQPYYNVAGFDLDKDMIIKGNMQYCPEACSFIPEEINKFQAGPRTNSEEYPGIREVYNGRYSVRCYLEGKRTFVGYYHTKEEAIEGYKEAKNKEARRLAETYKFCLNKSVYNTLMNYEA